jgi:hypothetical protein
VDYIIRRLGVKQTDIESIIQRYTDAEIAVLDGKSITFNGQQMTLENLSEIRKGVRNGSAVLLPCWLSVTGDPVINSRGFHEPVR